VTVYVESNFVLEQALQQEQSDSCDAIVDLAASGDLSLAIPAFSLAEPHQALTQKEKARNRLSNELRHQLSELGRSKPYRGVRADFGTLATVLISSADQERDGLKRAVTRLLSTAEVIPLDGAILTSAGELQAAFSMSGQDAIVFASVLRHLKQTAPTESCFLNRNSSDFDDPDVRERLDSFGCKYFGRFDNGLQYILTRLRIQGS
jgi:predicted nucleic acid-binding protein